VHLKISVVIPHYRAEKFVRIAVGSALNQTTPSFEVLFVDDCSGDLSSELLSDLAGLGVQTFVLSENVGQSAARNFGVSQAKGDLICFLDQDDMYLPTHNETLLEAFIADPKLDLAVGEFLVNGHSLNRRDRRFRDGKVGRDLSRAFVRERIRVGLEMVPGAMMVKKSTFLRAGGFDAELRGFEDEELVVRMVSQGDKGVLMARPVLDWRQRIDSWSYSRAFVFSRAKYFGNLSSMRQDLGISENSMRWLRLRYEALTCWDAIGLEMSKHELSTLETHYEATGVRSFFGLKLITFLLNSNPRMKSVIVRISASKEFRGILRLFGFVSRTSSLRLRLGRQ
jgi:glycosyltransferase involved in cell wall biosynthesis